MVAKATLRGGARVIEDSRQNRIALATSGLVAGRRGGQEAVRSLMRVTAALPGPQ
jgi:hypothetical protein